MGGKFLAALKKECLRFGLSLSIRITRIWKEAIQAMFWNALKAALYKNYVSYIYEDICREKMWELNAVGTFGFRFNKIGRYWGGKLGETDIVALDTVDKNIVVGSANTAHYKKVWRFCITLKAKQKS